MRRKSQFERTDRDITNALLTLLERTGLEKITVQDILEEAMINRSTFYLHYSDKYDVLERLQEKCISGLTETIDEITNTKGLNLDEINNGMFQYLQKNRKTFGVMIKIKSENLDLSKRMRELFAGYIRRQGQSLESIDAEMLAGMTVVFLENYLQNDTGERQFAEVLMDSWLRMTLFFFRLDTIPGAGEEIMSLVGKMHHDLQTGAE